MQRCISTGKQDKGERCHVRHSRPSDPTGRQPEEDHRTAPPGADRRSSDYLKPDVPLPEIPTAFLYLGCWFPVAGVVYYFFGMETKGKSIAEIDRELAPA